MYETCLARHFTFPSGASKGEVSTSILSNLRLGLSSGWKPINLTSVFPYGHSFIAASWYYTEGVDTDVADVKYRCSPMLDGFVSSHPVGPKKFYNFEQRQNLFNLKEFVSYSGLRPLL